VEQVHKVSKDLQVQLGGPVLKDKKVKYNWKYRFTRNNRSNWWYGWNRFTRYPRIYRSKRTKR
jgi:hypothetical protein